MILTSSLHQRKMHAGVPLQADYPDTKTLRDVRGSARCTGCGETRGSHVRDCERSRLAREGLRKTTSTDPALDLRGLRGCAGCGKKQGCHVSDCVNVWRVDKVECDPAGPVAEDDYYPEVLGYQNLDEVAEDDYYHCNGCGVEPILGVRWHCDTCDDFDLCSACYATLSIPGASAHTRTHTFVKHVIGSHLAADIAVGVCP